MFWVVMLAQHVLRLHAASDAPPKFALRLKGLRVEVRSWLSCIEAIYQG
jgi:hypothetical protein